MTHRTDTMLTLAKIGELVTMSLDTSEILKQVVAITAEIMKVDVCSIYLYDAANGALVLEATVGLKDDAVGNVRIKPGEGITGRAAKQGRLVAVKDVTYDKRNKYIPITGEEAFHSILSVPLKFQNENIGVINVQTKKPKIFKPIMTPNGIRTEPLVVPGPAHNDFVFEKQQADRSLKLMNESFRRQGRFTNRNTHEKEFF